MQQIKTALILAAGRGTRLNEMTDYIPKCLVEVNQKSLLDRMLEQLNEEGFTKLILVVGYKSDVIIKKFGLSYKNINIQYVMNAEWESSNNIISLYKAIDYITEDFLLIESDLIFNLEAIKLMKKPGLIAVEAFQSYMNGTVVDLDEESNVRAMYLNSSEDRPQQINGLYKTVNLYSFSYKDFHKHIVPILKNLINEGHSDVYYELSFEYAIKNNLVNFKAIDFRQIKWYEIDNQDDWTNATQLFKESFIEKQINPTCVEGKE